MDGAKHLARFFLIQYLRVFFFQTRAAVHPIAMAALVFRGSSIPSSKNINTIRLFHPPGLRSLIANSAVPARRRIDAATSAPPNPTQPASKVPSSGAATVARYWNIWEK